MRSLSVRALERASLIGLALFCAARADAVEFTYERVQGLVNVDVSYGLTYRLDRPDSELIGIANGGTATSVNGDDGELNQKHGIVSQMVRGTGELILAFENVGVYVRGAAFHDWALDGDLDRTPLTDVGHRLVGSDAQLLEHYIAWSMSIADTPVYFRVGDQVLSWQGTSFIRDGLDVINPFDSVASLQPAGLAQDNRTPQGMVWMGSSLTDIIAIEGYYQYDWEPVELPPVGSVFSTLDLYGGDGVKHHGVFFGQGQVSDLGTDLDQQFHLPQGTLGFDPQYDRMPGRAVDRPLDGGQYGISLFARFFDGLATKLALHYMRYHSRLPIVSGLTGDEQAVAATSDAAVAALADSLAPSYVGEGLDPAAAAIAARDAASNLTLSRYMNEAGYVVEFPKNIDVLGASFSVSSLHTGTLLSGEFARHFGFPYQLSLDTVLRAALSPVQFAPVGTTPLGEFGPDARIDGAYRADRTQAALGVRQLLGPQIHATQLLIDFDVGWIHVHDWPNNGDVPLQRIGATANSWGYRVVVAATYNSLFGGINMTPRIGYARDVSGTTPAPTTTFIEDRKTFAAGLNFDYLQRIVCDIGYTRFSGGGPTALLRDRDFAQFRLTYYF